MLEIIALIFITRRMGTLAHDKGLKPGTWKLYTVLAWFAGEIPGAIIGVLIFGIDNLISVELVALAGAVSGYFIIKNILSKKPNAGMEDDINQIGQE
ncbi:MAG: hypothetical protein H0W12_07675 [Chitinophagaceae bacterium]|nr:hypothetical protein [Chitinophagaceae bacterium]